MKPEQDLDLYVTEKIKARPINKKKVARKMFVAAISAVAFGLIACVTFVLLIPVLEEAFFPPERNVVEFSEEEIASEEISPEDMILEDKIDAHFGIEEEIEEKIEALLPPVEEGVTKIQEQEMLLKELTDTVKTWKTGFVTVSCITKEVTFLDSTARQEYSATGAIIADNGLEFLVLVDGSFYSTDGRLEVTLFDQSTYQGTIYGEDANTGLMIVAISKELIETDTLNELTVVELGISNQNDLLGSMVIAYGSPLGSVESVLYGVVTAMQVPVSAEDIGYYMIYTDMFASINQKGFLCNLNGEICGIITNKFHEEDLKQIVGAIGISELKKVISKLSNRIEIPYLGIESVRITEDAYQNSGIPRGTYVAKTTLNSPAMVAGILPGDFIIEMNEKEVRSLSQYTTQLYGLEANTTIPVVIARKTQTGYKEMTLDLTLGSLK